MMLEHRSTSRENGSIRQADQANRARRGKRRPGQSVCTATDKVAAAILVLLCVVGTSHARQWNNDVNSWTGLNGQHLEGGLVAWGNVDYGGTPNEPIGYAFEDNDRLLQ